VRLTPDGARYLAMAHGERQPMPFHVRPLMPAICGDSEVRWRIATFSSVAAATLLTGALAAQHGATIGQSVVAMLLLAGLPWVRFCLGAPVLVDMPMLAFALGAAVLLPVSMAGAAVCLLFGTLTSEKVPVLAALFAWSPLPLAFVVVVTLLLRILSAPGEIHANDPLRHTLESPLRTGLESHARQWRNPLRMLTPWGACIAVLAAPSVWICAALAVGYSQLLVATDTTRLYQTVAPVLCVAAALSIPESWAPAVVLAHWFNPVAGEGV